jgi:hypothetical protein
MSRTDAHRPSAINPDEYDFVACDYYGPWGGQIHLQDRINFRNHMARTGGLMATKHNTGTCHICGAAAMYVAKYHHLPSNTYIVTGLDCAMKLDMGDADLFKSFKKSIHKQREAEKGKARAKETLALLGLSRAWVLYDHGYDNSWKREEPIIQSIVEKLVRYGNMSEKQVTLIFKLLSDIDGRAERAAKAAAADAGSAWVGNVGERRDFDLTVRFMTSFEGHYGVTWITVMEDAGHNVVVYKGSRIAQERGERMMLKATVKEHGTRNNVKQTIISRPKVAEKVVA